MADDDRRVLAAVHDDLADVWTYSDEVMLRHALGAIIETIREYLDG